ncbi:hypothetical protein AAHC03_019076 [Spirometra sp. Aus1]
MTTFESIESLKDSIKAHKQLLETTDLSIRKITGRPLGEEGRNFSENLIKFPPKRPNLSGPLMIQSRVTEPIHSAQKRSLGDRPEEDLNVSLPSSVVRVSEKRSRTDAMKELKSSDRERGRRMFNILQSTLNQFKAETAAATHLPQAERRRLVDAKVEAKTIQEKETLRQERTDLFKKRRAQQVELALLHLKMRMIHGFEARKEETMKMVGFIRTETAPHLFFRPRADNKESEARKAATKEKLLELIERRRRKLETDFQEIAAARRRRLGLSDSERPISTAENHKVGPTDDHLDDDFAIVGEDDDEEEEDAEGGDGTWAPTLQSHVVAAGASGSDTQLPPSDSHRKVNLITTSITSSGGQRSSSSIAKAKVDPTAPPSDDDDEEEHFEVDEPVLMEDDTAQQQQQQQEPAQPLPDEELEDRRRVLLPPMEKEIQ